MGCGYVPHNIFPIRRGCFLIFGFNSKIDDSIVVMAHNVSDMKRFIGFYYFLLKSKRAFIDA